MSKLTAFFSALWALLKGPFTIIGAYMAGWARGMREQQAAQHEQDTKAANKGGVARTEYRRGGLRTEASRYHIDE